MSGKTAGTIGDLAGVSRSSAQKFFNGRPISVDNFQSLCNVLKVDWKTIVESEEIASSVTNRKRVAFVIEGSLDNLDPTQLAKLQAMVCSLQQLTGDASITTVDIEEGSIRLILEGSEEGIERLKQAFHKGELSKVLGIHVKAVGPIKSDIPDREGVREDCLKALLVSKIRSQGAVYAHLKGADFSYANLTNTDLRGADFSCANLTNTDLRGADFSCANLANTDLRGAKLSDADLSGAGLTHGLDMPRAKTITLTIRIALVVNVSVAVVAALLVALPTYVTISINTVIIPRVIIPRVIILTFFITQAVITFLIAANVRASSVRVRGRDRNPRKINLSSANLNGANLSGVDVSAADLSSTNLKGAIVENTLFGKGIGLTESEKRDLKRRGAIFDESTGDRSSISSSVR